MFIDFEAEGYQDGFEDNECFVSFDTPFQEKLYRRGYERGQKDREEVNRAQSSNS